MPYLFTKIRSGVSAILCCVVLALFGLTGSLSLVAQEKQPVKKTSILLMKTGRMVSGEISESAGGYLVSSQTGSMLVPFSDVVFEAGDLNGIYLKQRASMKFPTANTHMNLARWCITNNLIEEAKDELRDAIRLEPKRSEPQLMLQRLMSISPGQKQLTVQEKIQEKLLTKKMENTDEATSMTGISREQSAIFVRKVQPILLNKCGNANCHGNATTSKFQLTQVTRRYGNHRIYAEKNLAEVMKWLDFDYPADSPLVVKPEREHPQNGMEVYEGYAGRKQKEIIQKWVGAAVADRLSNDTLRADRLAKRANRRVGFARENLLKQAAEIRPRSGASNSGLEQALMEQDVLDGAGAGQPAIQQTGAQADPVPKKGDVSLIADFVPKRLSDQEINKLVKPKPADPFDPEAFNSAVPLKP
ncbi:hypothetical protein [Gimesia panareensis]|uniref:hypothetical protein n=1 Tax=Gimesia panareensis TaxID=2527978 RepID=UPI00118AB896|nr:hypothetical protein [Gimesia panareensis]QDU50147.1 hypothetical protein Pan110_24890 [Gimesia panareensis]